MDAWEYGNNSQSGKAQGYKQKQLFLVPQPLIFFMSTRSTKINTGWLFPLKFEEPPTQNIYTDFMDSLLHSHFKERKIYNMHEEGLRNDDLNFSNAFFSPTPLLIINIRNRECPLPCIDGKLFGCFIHGLELFKYC